MLTEYLKITKYNFHYKFLSQFGINFFLTK